MDDKILVSACLAGYNCRYDGGNNFHPGIAELVEKGVAVPVCPEQLGGLPTPRPACEIKGGDGCRVLAGGARVENINGKDVTGQFIDGAEKALTEALKHNTKMAILKERSPSCGVHFIYDGTFQGGKISGQGVLAALLTRNGVKLYSEEDIPTGSDDLVDFVQVRQR
ncbi:uncharacterized protein YbbK (DUF523 family) [Desulfohalotomaculum tongense]|uniref:DUF523 domain-containing protein n=1 Tax=Desulforadius tongensis TaxID=1216062 RepID=UPI00195884D5|nr:DUF523 domain-containing protein [Desulforadius tongensis]MBM7856019.1 uncharacterized protein YbbK (DUF523 family) [Desulforadius tongensis]